MMMPSTTHVMGFMRTRRIYSHQRSETETGALIGLYLSGCVVSTSGIVTLR